MRLKDPDGWGTGENVGWGDLECLVIGRILVGMGMYWFGMGL